MKPSRLYPDMFQEPLEQGEFSSCIVVTFQVMAIAWVSPGDPDPIRPMAESGQYKLRTHTGGTGHADNPEMLGVLEATHPGQISCSITAPVT